MGNRLLICEDEPLIAWDIEAEMRSRGWDVAGPAGNAADALAILSHTPVDAALLDIELGDGDSFEVARALVGQAVPVVFLSGHSREVLPDALAHRGIHAKPVAFERLDRALRSAARER